MTIWIPTLSGKFAPCHTAVLINNDSFPGCIWTQGNSTEIEFICRTAGQGVNNAHVDILKFKPRNRYYNSLKKQVKAWRKPWRTWYLYNKAHRDPCALTAVSGVHATWTIVARSRSSFLSYLSPFGATRPVDRRIPQHATLVRLLTEG